MSLILCKLSLEVVVDADTMGKASGDLAKRFASDELDHLQLDSVEWVTSLSQLPRNWHDSLPYRDPNIGPELTCRQILAAKVLP
jgi:hypothetical protein